MWQLKTLTIQNPAGLSIEPTVNWLGETHLFGPQREVLFTALTQQLLRPQCSVTLGFNPRAQMFRSLQNILSLAESVLSLTNGHPSEKGIGAIVANEKDNLKHELQSSSIQKMLQMSAEKEVPLWEVVKVEGMNNQKAPKLLKQFVEMILSFTAKKDTENAFDLATMAAKQSGLIDLLKADGTPEGV